MIHFAIIELALIIGYSGAGEVRYGHGRALEIAFLPRSEGINESLNSRLGTSSLQLHPLILKAKIVPKIRRLEDQLGYLIASLSRQLDEEISEKIRPEGIPIEQFRVLSAVSEAEGLSMRSLASQALVDPTTLTKIIDKMVMEALVYRSPAPEDRRKVMIFLAPRGQALQRRLTGVLDEQQRSLVKKLNGPKAEELMRLLRGLMQE